MALTTRTLPAINNGVSRQPAILRSTDQTEDEVNTWGEIASGVARRPPTRFVTEITGAELDGAFIHHINRDVSERYLVIINEGFLKVFDHETGEEKAVATPGGLAYLNAPGSAYRAVTVADYTFIVNSQMTCLLGEVEADQAVQPPYYIWPGGSIAQPERRWDVGDYDVPIPGDPYQYAPNPPAGSALTGTVQKFEDLPDSPATGALYKVSGSAETGFVSYYVIWNGTVWDETVAPALANAIDAVTMPHALVRQPDGSFVFAPFSWKPRRVGDTITNPAPPFINRKFRDVFFYKNRLGFLVDESVVFSTAGDYGDFWRRTVLDYVESDTLSVAATTTDVALLDYAVPFNDGIMLFSAQRQFSLSNGESGLSAASIEINPVTSFVTSPGVRPVPLGNQVFFASDSGGYVALQEYSRLDGSDATDAADITAHVPGLIKTGVSRLIPIPDLNAVVVLRAGAQDANKVFVYQYFWDGDRKILSAWRPWDFGDGHVVSGVFLDGELHLLIRRGSSYFLEKMDLRPEAASEGQEHLIHLDRSSLLEGVYDPEAGRTTFTIPYVPTADTFRIVRGSDAAHPESMIPPAGYVFDGLEVSVPGNESAHAVTVGEVYETRLVFGRQFPLDYQQRPLTTGRLQLHTFTVFHSETAYFEAKVQPYGRDAVADGDLTQTVVFNGRVIGSNTYRLGSRPYRTAAFTFPVAGDAAIAYVALTNSSPYASVWVSAEWEGLFFSRAFG